MPDAVGTPDLVWLDVACRERMGRASSASDTTVSPRHTRPRPGDLVADRLAVAADPAWFERGLTRGGADAIVAAAGVAVAAPTEVERITRRPNRWVAADLRVQPRHGRPYTLVAVAAADHELPDGVMVVDRDQLASSGAWPHHAELLVGAFPLVEDPRLPGLATACSLVRLSAWLGARVVAVQRRRYRHLHRAVLRAQMGNGSVVWVKAVRPGRAAGLVERHALVRRAVVCPEVLRHDDDLGLVACTDLAGLELRAAVRADQLDAGHAWPRAADVIDVSDRLAATRSPAPSRRRTPLAGVARHAAALCDVLPEAADRAAVLAETLSAHTPVSPRLAGTTVHGDLHAAQLVCRPLGHDRGGRLGLLDLDDVGAGDPLDDRCRLLGHLIGTVEARPTPHGRALLADLRHVLRVDEHVDARLRVTAVLLGQALGPHRASRSGWRAHALHRLRTAERWATGDTSLHPR